MFDKNLTMEQKQAFVRSLTDDQIKAVMPLNVVTCFEKHPFMFKAFRLMGEGSFQEADKILTVEFDKIENPAEQIQILQSLGDFAKAVEQLRAPPTPKQGIDIKQLLAFLIGDFDEPEDPKLIAAYEKLNKEGIDIHLSRTQLDALLDMGEDACSFQKAVLKTAPKTTKGMTPQQFTSYNTGIRRHNEGHELITDIKRQLIAKFPDLG